MLALFSETLELYLRCKADVEKFGTLVQGRSAQELVRNPSLITMAQARADLIRCARAVPMVSPNVDHEGIGIDHLLQELR
jgi:phage terminase small subunit